MRQRRPLSYSEIQSPKTAPGGRPRASRAGSDRPPFPALDANIGSRGRPDPTIPNRRSPYAGHESGEGEEGEPLPIGDTLGATPEDSPVLTRSQPDPVRGMPSDRELRRFLLALMQSGMGLDDILHHAGEQYPGLASELTRAAYHETLRQWEAQYTDDLPRAKAAQIARLRRDLTRLRSQRTPNFTSIAKLEDLWARIAGTYEPARVAVDVGIEVQRAIVAVVVGMSDADQEALIEEQRRLEASAGVAPVIPLRRSG